MADESIESAALGFRAAEFGWALRLAANFQQVRELTGQRNAVGVLFDARFLRMSPEEALREIAASAPGAYPVVCHHLSEVIDWPLLVESGAFHSLPIPFHEPELRQTLGFIWAADRAREAARFPQKPSRAAAGRAA